jgi:hypothetical protein
MQQESRCTKILMILPIHMAFDDLTPKLVTSTSLYYLFQGATQML